MCQHLDGGRAPDANQMPDVPDVLKYPVFFYTSIKQSMGRGDSTLQTFQICTLTSPLPLLPTVVSCCLLLPTVVQCAHFFYGEYWRQMALPSLAKCKISLMCYNIITPIAKKYIRIPVFFFLDTKKEVFLPNW